MKENVLSIRKALIRRFFLYSITAIALYISCLVIALGPRQSVPFLVVMIIVTPLILAVSGGVYYPLHNRIVPVIEDENRKGENPADRHLGELFPAYSGFAIGVPSAAGFAVAMIVVFSRGVLYSWQQAVFFFAIGTILSFTMGYQFFYFARIEMYGLSVRMNFSPLKLFGKLAIPILTVILISLSYAEVGLYRIIVKQIFTLKNEVILQSLNKQTNYLDRFFSRPFEQINGMVTCDAFDSMNMERMRRYLAGVHASAADMDVEFFFAANASGECVVSNGQTLNISDRSYFREVLETGKYRFSEPIVNKVTGKETIVCAVPVVRGGRVIGILAAPILTETCLKVLLKDSIMKTGRYMIINAGGKCLFSQDAGLAGKVPGKDITDNGSTIRGFSNIVTGKENELLAYVYNGEKLFCLKSPIPLLGYTLVLSFNQNDLMREVNFALIEMVIAMMFLVVLLIFVILNIAKSFSLPIRNTISVIHRLADGDLNAKSDDFLPDEFGELIRNLKLFQRKLKGIIQQALFSSEQLSSSAEELAATSQSLSEGAQSQAASVEEASASLEEVSGAVELINNNAGEQAGLARTTFSSMEKLKKDNETVVDYAAEALKAAKNTTDQASTGQNLMESTIAGMNSIDESTKKIAETVRLISDISDQVNLLALNASIEAARAGEHGKGFAVVAEEISKLADQTASSAKTINDLVKTGLHEVNRGREYVDATGAALKNIIGFIKETEEIVRKITDSAREQAASSSAVLADTRQVMEMSDNISSSTHEQMMTNQEMSKTVEQINQNTQAAAAASEQIASSAEEISAQAESLRMQMQFFKV